jgi:hypothetical protein
MTSFRTVDWLNHLPSQLIRLLTKMGGIQAQKGGEKERKKEGQGKRITP